MLDKAGFQMAQGASIACERIIGVNDNMSKSHYHDYFELYYLESGERYHIVNNQIYHITSRQFILFPPYVMHHSYGDDNVQFQRVIVYFRPENIHNPDLLDWLMQCDHPFEGDIAQSQIIRKIINQILEEQTYPKTFTLEYQRAWLNLLAVELMRFHQTKVRPLNNTRIGHILDYIHEHYTEDITLEDIAKDSYISTYYMCREFKKATNQTIVQYINTTRIMDAQRQISETDRKITEISDHTGFSNVTHFNRVFKQITGMSPSAYRKSKAGQA